MVLESLKRKLAPIRMYRTNARYLGYELKIYADEIERLYEELDAMFPERFISTATGIGLSQYEEMFGPAREDLPTDTRRELLLLRLTLGGGDFTPAGVRQALDSFGLEYVISEYPTFNRLNIIAQSEYSRAEQAFIEREVTKIVPAHLEFQIVFNTPMWSDLDGRNKTFAQLDQDNLMWKEIDSPD